MEPITFAPAGGMTLAHSPANSYPPIKKTIRLSGGAGMSVVSSSSRKLDRGSAFTTSVERTNSTADPRNLRGTVKHRFMDMMEVHDRVRARFLTTVQPSGSRKTPK